MTRRFSEEKRLEWKEKILQQQESGLPINQWCEQNQIIPHCFHYWKNKFFPKPKLTRSSFAELPQSKEPDIFLEYHGVRICVKRSFDPAVLKSCLFVLREIQC